MGIRALELARALSRGLDVTLLVPNREEEALAVAAGLRVASLGTAASAAAASAADVALVSGHAANAWFGDFPRVPVAADLYDPFMIENLHYAPALGPGPARHDLEALRRALRRADFFLCASPEQRLFYAGALYEIGRIGAHNFPEDPELSRLLAIVPFGVPDEPARGDRAAGRRALGLPEDALLVLFGGVYDWSDPDLLLRAWPEIRRLFPAARLLFFENPNRETTPQRVYEAALAASRRMDPSGESIRFAPWRAYGERADLYAATDVLVSISAEGLESDLAFRTRLLDAAWGGVPSVSIAGGSLARELESAGAGRQCARDVSALVRAVGEILSAGNAAREAARSFAAGRTWSATAAPLAAWCRDAAVDPGRLSAPASGGIGRLLRGRFADILRGE